MTNMVRMLLRMVELAVGMSLFAHVVGISLGGGGSSRGRSRQRRGEDVVHPLEVSLDDLYNGTSKKFSVARNVLCSKCKGKGSKSGASMTCAGCHRCPTCKGEKVVQQKKVLEVHVEKGMKNGQKITFPGEAEEAVCIYPLFLQPDTVTRDIVFVLQQKQEQYPKFKRKGDDLFVEHTLSLNEALCGFQFAVVHLDNRQLLIKSQPGEVVKPDHIKEINDEGMPIYKRPLKKGKLYIHFNVEFPDSLTSEQCKALETILPSKPSAQLLSAMEIDEREETTMHDVNMEEGMRRKQAQPGTELRI